MHLIKKILTSASFLIISGIYMFLPSVNMDSMMNGTQSGKTFIFLSLVIIMSVILLLQFLFFNRTRNFRINILDVFLLIWCLYIILNDYLQNVPFSLRLFEFYGLIILYIALRSIRRKYLIWLYIVLILGGGIQAVYGNLQLWGYFPSHHGLFKMTGSFFNPGPYAGYLAAAFPVSLGIFLFNPRITLPEQNNFVLKLTYYFDRTKNFFKKIPLKLPFFNNNSGEVLTPEKQLHRLKHAGYFTLKSLVLISLLSETFKSKSA